ncbi:hypothetical protein BAE44_0020256, partial [Dichanthelium oligosanthes]
MHAKDLGSLHHLRYLKLEGNLETELLEEIGNLQLLKTLDLQRASINELPTSICRLRKLDCLDVGFVLVIGVDQPFRMFQHPTRCWLVFAKGVMPNLERLKFCFQVPKREGGDYDIGLENLASLKHVTVGVDCEGAQIREVDNVETMVRNAIGMHPNHPTLQLSRYNEDDSDEDTDDSWASEE